MKKSLYLYLFLLLTTFTCAQTDYSLKSYFKENILDLDPIEGVYDVECNMRYITPFVDQKSKDYFTWYIKNEGGYFVVYLLENGSVKRRESYYSKVGETNAYMFHSNLGFQERFVLNNSIQFDFTTLLNHSAAIKLTGNPNLAGSVRIYLTYNAIKKYPTHSMYITALEEAIREEQEQARQREIEMSKPTEWTGTGFALNGDYIVTNYHVVEDARSIIVKGIKGDFNTVYTAEVAATDKYNDIAVLKVSDTKFTGFGTIPYKIKTSIADVGEDIFVLGYPLTTTMGDEIKLTTGVVSSRTGFQGDVALYQISAPVQPGNSGGPLFDGKGNLIGIVSAKHTGAENVGYAIKASYLMNLVESSITGNIMPANNTISTLPLTGKVKNVKSFVFLIECSSK